jgi:rubredoxin
MKELVRCKACGYVMEAGKLKDVCPACGMSNKVFEPYRERVALNRLFVLSLDLHPITIHLSQTFVILIPLMLIARNMFPDFYNGIFSQVLIFCIYAFPLTLMAAAATGIIDGLFRFKSLKPPLLKEKLGFSISLVLSSLCVFIIDKKGGNDLLTFMFSITCLYFAVRLGLLGKKLLNVILPGSYPVKKVKATPKRENSAG